VEIGREWESPHSDTSANGRAHFSARRAPFPRRGVPGRAVKTPPFLTRSAAWPTITLDEPLCAPGTAVDNLMTEQVSERAVEEKLLHTGKRDWQFWSLVVLGLALLGLGFAIYELLISPPQAWTAHGVAGLVPPLIFGVLALLVLVNFYAARKDAVIRGLEEELTHQKIETELNRELALLDPVTEVYNRRYLRALLSKEVSRIKRYGKGLSVMLVDITGFRRVNQSLGHTGGDVVLRQLAQLLQSRVRNSDMIIRFGGDEFLLILPDTDEPGYLRLHVRLKEAIADWSRRSGMTEFALSFAVGAARFTADRNIDEILKLAEQRMMQDRRAPSEAPGGRAPHPAQEKVTS
jgi:diguanylate cyclase (GGDEF)-like protein